MILLTHDSKIQLGVQHADFRKGVDGFVALCKNQLLQEPRDGTIFVFINRAKTMIRALSYDGTGYWLMTKRLSRGKYKHWPSTQGKLSTTSARELRQIINAESWQPSDSYSASTTTSGLQNQLKSAKVNPSTVT